VMRRYRGREDDAATCALGAQLACDSLCADKGASQIDLMGPPPFVGKHLDSRRALHKEMRSQYCRRSTSTGATHQPTTPAKQQSMSTLPSTLTELSTANAIWFSSRTSTASVMMRRSGNWECRSFTASNALSGFTSHKARPDAPCSRRALAASRASVPAPPVTKDVFVSRSFSGVRCYEKQAGCVPRGGVHVLIALPLTWNLYAALWAGVRLSGGGRGAVNGFSAVDSVISGSCRLTSEARSSDFSGMASCVDVLGAIAFNSSSRM
jgi:hypothetical protein